MIKILIILLATSCMADVRFFTNLYEKALALITRLINAVKSLINNAIRIFDNTTRKVLQEADKSIERFRDSVNSVTLKARETLNNLKKAFINKVSSDVMDKCIMEGYIQLEDIFKTLIEMHVSCVTEEANEGFRLINEAAELIINSSNNILDLSTIISNCDGKESCLKDVSKKTIDMEKNVPADIMTKITDISTFAVGMYIRFNLCAAANLAEAAKLIPDILTKAQACVHVSNK